MFTAILLLGGNLGNVPHTFAQTLETLKTYGILAQVSKIYTSEAWGFEAPEIFYNQAVVLQTLITPEQLLDNLLNIEKIQGRNRNSIGYSSRTIDIDILFFDGQIINNPKLTIPHPRLHLRNFAMVPLAEIIPNFIHPVFKLSISELLLRSEDQSKISEYTRGA